MHSRCTCGRGLPLLKELQGRTTDFVVAADGTVMHGLALIYVVRELPGIEGFKVVQWTREHTEVQLVAGPGFDPASPARVAEGMRRRLGAAVRVDVNLVDAIAPEKSGKYRYIVSHALGNAPAAATAG